MLVSIFAPAHIPGLGVRGHTGRARAEILPGVGGGWVGVEHAGQRTVGDDVQPGQMAISGQKPS